MTRRAMITGLEGATLTEPEQRFLESARPLGIILFARNISSPAQITKLVSQARDAIGSPDMLVLIDQEGGRVARLKPPLGRALPPAGSYGALYAHDPQTACEAAYLAARLLADDLTKLGINCNCAPVLDIPAPGSHDIIGDRAYGTTPEQVIALGRAVAQGFIHGSVLPVIKHIPGHGRATEDSHLALPVVDAPQAELERIDFAPFAALKDIPAAMTAHVLYSDIDAHAPASTSRKVIEEIIRQYIGFDGLLMSDDLSMKALPGPMRERALAVIAAGSDVALHCNGNLIEMQAVAGAVPDLDDEETEVIRQTPACKRFQAAIEVVRGSYQKPFDTNKAQHALAQICAHSA